MSSIMTPARHHQMPRSSGEELAESRGPNPIMIKVLDNSYHASFGLLSTVQSERLEEETSVRLDVTTVNDLYDDAMEVLYCHRRRKERLGVYAWDHPSYPEGVMNRASLVALSADDRKSSGGKFLEMLGAHQSGQNNSSSSGAHQSGQNNSSSSSLGFLIRQAQTGSGSSSSSSVTASKLRLSIIPTDSPPVVIDFDSDKDYWFMLSAIKRAIGWLTIILRTLSLHHLLILTVTRSPNPLSGT